MRPLQWIWQFGTLCSIICLSSSYGNQIDQEPLRTRDLFQDSEKYKCLIEGKEEFCAKDVEEVEENHTFKIRYGPKFQRVHLTLPRLEPYKVDQERTLTIDGRQKMTIKTLSVQPPVFEIPNFLDAEECEAIIYLAKEKGMKPLQPAVRPCLLPDTITYTMFDQWDLNMDGILSNSEIAKIPELSSYLLTYKDITKILRQASIDQDNDGFVTYEEFREANITHLRNTVDALNEKRSGKAFSNVDHTWLWQDEEELLSFDDVLLDYHDRLKSLTDVPKSLLEQTEPLQVVRHGVGSSSPCHHDSDPIDLQNSCCMNGARHCRMCRYLTVMYFLNDVEEGGDLTFPVANDKELTAENMTERYTQKCSWNRSFPLANLRIKPERGKAVLWYNHMIEDGTGWLGDLDAYSIQSEGEVKSGEKWTAKVWVDIIGDGVTSIRPWKSGSNWLNGVNKKLDVVEKMRNDHFIEGMSYYHSRMKYAEEHNRPSTEEIEDSVKSQNNEPSQPSEVEELKDNSGDQEVAHSSLDSHRKQEETGDLVTIETITNGANTDVEKNKETGTETDKKTMGTEPQTLLSRPSFRGMSDKPLGPPPRTPFPDPLPAGKMEGNKIVRSVLLLIDELERDELEIIARVLHERLQLACIPLMVNPVGPI